jgi:eukaryotic-like serine/threonine-protein kinase
MTIGSLTLELEIGAGAMGSVWAARDSTGATVAVKLLRDELEADADVRRRFRREAMALSSLEHPAIVRVLGASPASSARTYLVMERVSGQTLEGRLTEGALPPEHVRGIGIALGEALSVVHAAGILHGDIKPANIFLVGPNAVRLVDFGLSKIEGLERLTRTGEVAGTPEYMAPELLTGGRELDPRLDQYALGIALFWALSGRSPFARAKHPGAFLLEIMSGRRPPLAEVASEAPKELCAIIERACAFDPEARFSDMDEMTRALQRCLA